MNERHIFCRPERLAYTAIYDAATTYGAQVFPHLRIKEVANRDWINPEHFDYALKGQIDFTVALDFRPVLAIELDGKFHQTPKAREGDWRKDDLCDALEIPLVRIDYGYMRAELLEGILGELVHRWLAIPGQFNHHSQHELILRPTLLQFDAARRKFGSILAAQITTSSEFTIKTSELPNRYFESTISVVIAGAEYVLGKGRARTPATSPMCGALLAERIASAEAGTYMHATDRLSCDAAEELVCLHSLCKHTESPTANACSRAIPQIQAIPAFIQ